MPLFVFSDPWLSDLKRDLKCTQKKACVQCTIKTFKSQWKTFSTLNELSGSDQLQISTEDLNVYIKSLTRSLKSPKSICNYVSGLNVFSPIV